MAATLACCRSQHNRPPQPPTALRLLSAQRLVIFSLRRARPTRSIWPQTLRWMSPPISTATRVRAAQLSTQAPTNATGQALSRPVFAHRVIVQVRRLDDLQSHRNVAHTDRIFRSHQDRIDADGPIVDERAVLASQVFEAAMVAQSLQRCVYARDRWVFEHEGTVRASADHDLCRAQVDRLRLRMNSHPRRPHRPIREHIHGSVKKSACGEGRALGSERFQRDIGHPVESSSAQAPDQAAAP